jgi:sugar phosphate isomerase/epimerase
MDPIKRRDFVKQISLAGGGLAAAPSLFASPAWHEAPSDHSWNIHFFSKHLQFLDYGEAAYACAAAGMSGADLTVRPGGHVLPENVSRDLPRAVKAFRAAGLNIEMMASGITDPDDPLTEKVLQIASEMGVRYYRLGYYLYDPALSMGSNLEKIKVKMNGLARLNEKYQIHGAYQNHAGSNFGAPVWDLWEVIRELDPQWTGCQYDIRHATVEGNHSWPLGLKLLKDHIRCLVIKDFKWGEKDGKAVELNVPVGEGIVDFQTYFTMLSELHIHGPITIHLEYPMFPDKEMSLEQKKARAIELMVKDLDALKKYL